MIAFADLSEHIDPDTLPFLDRPGIDETALTSEQNDWRRDGVVILPDFLPGDAIDAYVARRSRLNDIAGWRSPTPYLHVPEMRALALYPPLMTMMRSLVGEEMLLHLALTGWISTDRSWHQDDYLNPPEVNGWYAAVWMALETIDPDSGPLEYIPGSHRWPALRGEKVRRFLTEEELARREGPLGVNFWEKYSERFVTPAIEAEIVARGLPITAFLPNRGDVLIWHARLMHRGSTPRRPGLLRRSLITHYSGIHHRPDMPVRRIDDNGMWYAWFDHPLPE